MEVDIVHQNLLCIICSNIEQLLKCPPGYCIHKNMYLLEPGCLHSAWYLLLQTPVWHLLEGLYCLRLPHYFRQLH